MKRAFLCSLAGTVALTAPAAPAVAAPNPDSPAGTPIARSSAATATSSISRSQMCAALKADDASGGRASGLYVLDATRGKGQVVCARQGRTRRTPASNMKLFTTATALARFGPDDRLSSPSRRARRLPCGVPNRPRGYAPVKILLRGG